MGKGPKKAKFQGDTAQKPLRIRRQIARYGKPWSELSDNERWYQRHKVRSRGRPVNAYIPFPREPACYGDWDDDACGVCGQPYEKFNAGINWTDGVDLMLDYARRENVAGGGYRSRGAVLYAMAVLKRQAFFMRHELGCCRVVFELKNYQVGAQDFNFFPYPRIVWYLVQYGQQDKKGKANITEAKAIEKAIDQAIQKGALRLDDFKELKTRIRKLEKKYQYKDWWREMKRETNGSGKFFEYSPEPEEELFLEEVFPVSYDDEEGDLPF